jgi:hypothetical protein
MKDKIQKVIELAGPTEGNRVLRKVAEALARAAKFDDAILTLGGRPRVIRFSIRLPSFDLAGILQHY